jgi:hypothetical protein
MFRNQGEKIMKCQGKFIKLFAFLIVGFVAFQITLKSMDQAVTHSQLKVDTFNCFPRHAPAMPSDIVQQALSVQTSSPMDRIFQLIFILFFISPPLIVVLLFLIWCELKKRNDNK